MSGKEIEKMEKKKVKLTIVDEAEDQVVLKKFGTIELKGIFPADLVLKINHFPKTFSLNIWLLNISELFTIAISF